MPTPVDLSRLRYPNACSKSASRSAVSSNPTEKRISPSEIPIFWRFSRPISQKIVGATGMIKLRVSLKPVATTGSFRRLMNFRQAASPPPSPATSKESSHDPARKCYLANACCGCDSSIG